MFIYIFHDFVGFSGNYYFGAKNLPLSTKYNWMRLWKKAKLYTVQYNDKV